MKHHNFIAKTMIGILMVLPLSACDGLEQAFFQKTFLYKKDK